MRKKRLMLCVLLALVLTVQMGWSGSAGWAAEAELMLPEEDPASLEDLIQVVVPHTGRLMANPYGLEVATETGTSWEQIVHDPQALQNLSGFPVSVSVTLTGEATAGSGASFVSAPPSPDAAGKDVFLYAEFQSQPNRWEGAYAGLPNQIVASEWGNEAVDVLTLEAQEVGYFRLSGEMVASPEQPWNQADTFNASLAFRFTPIHEDTAALEPQEPGIMPDVSDDPAAPEEGFIPPAEPSDAVDSIEPPGTPPPFEPDDIPEQSGDVMDTPETGVPSDAPYFD